MEAEQQGARTRIAGLTQVRFPGAEAEEYVRSVGVSDWQCWQDMVCGSLQRRVPACLFEPLQHKRDRLGKVSDPVKSRLVQ